MTDRVRETGGEFESGSALLVTLRAALREAASADRTLAAETRVRGQLEDATRPLLDRFVQPLLIWCQDLTAGLPDVPGRAHLEGADLAQEAWVRVLRYLNGPKGNRVRNDSHLARLLRCTARNYLYDVLGSAPMLAESSAISLDAPGSVGGIGQSTEPRQGARLLAPEETPDILRFAGSGPQGDLIDALFTNEAAFRQAGQVAGVRRHPRQFRAYVLYELGVFLWREIEGAPTDAAEEVAGLLREFTAATGVPAGWWDTVEAVVMNHVSADDTDRNDAIILLLLATVNQLCGASVKAGNALSVLRHDLNQCAVVWERTGDGRIS